ncbi:MAG: prolipoprotein diacylglyceryl transferase [Cytophagales bacterium]|nr:prolipoprotein diacylglyceryl transferase [Cytophagales bacterium]
MNTFLDFIVWTPSPEIFDFGSIKLRWYGLLFASGFIIGQKIISNIFKKVGRTEKDVETLAIYMVVGTVLGARLGHCLFYDPTHYLSNPLEIIKVWEGGLASHGGGIGMLLACFLYARKYEVKNYIWLIDRIVLTVAIGGCLIRFGNLMNSEIIGKATNAGHGFVFVHNTHQSLSYASHGNIQETTFEKIAGDTTINKQQYQALKMNVRFDKNMNQEQIKGYLLGDIKKLLNTQIRPDNRHVFIYGNPAIDVKRNEDGFLVASLTAYGLPRHPAQLYESLSCLFIAILLLGLYKKYGEDIPDGLLFGLFATLVFSLRFSYEFIKENQVSMEDGWALNMGQILSIPLVLFGLFLLFRAISQKNEPQKLSE